MNKRDLSYEAGCLSSADRAQLLSIIGLCFEGIDPEAYFAYYFEQSGPTHRRLRLYYSDSAELIGYCLLTFDDSHTALSVIGASAGFLPQFRGKNNTFTFSIFEVTKAYLRRPWRTLLYADTMLSPAMFRAMAKNIAIVYPTATGSPVESQLYVALNPTGLVSEVNGLPCLKVVGRKTRYSALEVAEFKASKKPEIAHYCALNPNFDKGVALLTVIPVTLGQLLSTAWKQLKHSR
ncbi:hypothetical protein [Pseudoalteromonas rubra]|uniref:hypothetical protein n=1 Tax=Pseudoalteromonas rubra TaxID=43658 RepID=UPI002DBB8FD4|nr:hypothetical protein [Pseudoalteromonas rubra]MEC4091543.1 hypothetical protein [Pseudoalteromonas rubra]